MTCVTFLDYLMRDASETHSLLLHVCKIILLFLVDYNVLSISH